MYAAIGIWNQEKKACKGAKEEALKRAQGTKQPESSDTEMEKVLEAKLVAAMPETPWTLRSAPPVYMWTTEKVLWTWKAAKMQFLAVKPEEEDQKSPDHLELAPAEPLDPEEGMVTASAASTTDMDLCQSSEGDLPRPISSDGMWVAQQVVRGPLYLLTWSDCLAHATDDSVEGNIKEVPGVISQAHAKQHGLFQRSLDAEEPWCGSVWGYSEPCLNLCIVILVIWQSASIWLRVSVGIFMA